jgi:hypothetical protein
LSEIDCVQEQKITNSRQANANRKCAPDNGPSAVPVQLYKPFFRWTSDNAQERVQQVAMTPSPSPPPPPPAHTCHLQLNMTDNVILVALLNAYGRWVTANRAKDFYAGQ